MRALILARTVACLEPLAGVPVVVRLVRALAQAGVDAVRVVSTLPEADIPRLRGALGAEPPSVEVIQAPSGSATDSALLRRLWPAGASRVLVIDAGLTVHLLILRALSGAGRTTAVVDRDPVAESLMAEVPRSRDGFQAPLAVIDRAWLEGREGDVWSALGDAVRRREPHVVDVGGLTGYSEELRRVVRPFWFPSPPPSRRAAAERLLVRGAQKGTQDLIAYAHAPIEDGLALWCARRGISPDHVTLASNVLAWAVVPLFLLGHLGVGLVLAAVVGVLDGVDGKVARTIVRTTPLGRMEQTLDEISQIAWVVAAVIHLWASGIEPWAWHVGVAIAVFGVTDSQLQKVVRARTGRFIDQYGPFDHFVRLLSARRNSFVWILIVGHLAGAPGRAFLLLPVLGAVTTVIHLPRAWWILRRARRDGGSVRGPLESTDPSY